MIIRLLPVLFVSLTVLSGCTTPRTMLRNPTTGQVQTCGGDTTSSLAGGLIGYSIQQNADADCVAAFTAQGFVRIR